MIFITEHMLNITDRVVNRLAASAARRLAGTLNRTSFHISRTYTRTHTHTPVTLSPALVNSLFPLFSYTSTSFQLIKIRTVSFCRTCSKVRKKTDWVEYEQPETHRPPRPHPSPDTRQYNQRNKNISKLTVELSSVQ